MKIQFKMVAQDQETFYTEMTMDRVKEAAMNCSFRASLIKSKK